MFDRVPNRLMLARTKKDCMLQKKLPVSLDPKKSRGLGPYSDQKNNF